MGDVGYLDDDGFLFIVDRQADMVISGGVNIYPVEIEGRAARHARRGRLRGVRHPRRRVR
jgi:long-chain acyl-CoA synthetase